MGRLGFKVGAGSSRRMRWIAAAAVVPVLLWAKSATAAETTVEVLSGKDSRNVELGVCPDAKQIKNGEGSKAAAGCDPDVSATAPFLGGETTLLLRLSTKVDPSLSVRFVPESRGAEKVVCGEDPVVSIVIDERTPSKGCSLAPVAVRGGEVFPLRVAFRLPVGEPASAIAGNLILTLDKRDETTPIPLTGSLRELKGVEVVPEKLTLDSDNATAKVRLVGPGVVELLRAGALGGATAQLRNEAGDTVKATVKFDKLRKVEAGSTPDLAKGTLTLGDDDPKPGTYTGKLPVSDAVSGGPSIEVELKAHKSPLLMFVLVFAGIVLVGVGTRLVTMTTRRRMLWETLLESVHRYRELRKRYGESRAWDLADLLGSNWRRSAGSRWERVKHAIKRWATDFGSRSSKVRLQGLEALKKSIREARSSKDLDEDSARVLDMVARIQRWLRVEPVARRLAEVVEESTPKTCLEAVPSGKDDDGKKKKKKNGEGKGGKGALHWEESQVYLETRALQSMARREPVDAEKADDLVGRLIHQIAIHYAFRALWMRASDDADITAQLIAFDEQIKEEKTTAGGRGAEQRDALRSRLCSIADRHHGVSGSAEGPEDPAEWIFPKRKGEKGGDEERECLELTAADWKASPNLFLGWASLDRPSYGQLVRRTATSSRAGYRRGGFGGSLLMEVCTLRPADVAWTGAILAISAAAYSATNYSHTWGSGEDMAKAFLAGAVGTVTVKWAALPIFRSGRIRAAEKK